MLGALRKAAANVRAVPLAALALLLSAVCVDAVTTNNVVLVHGLAGSASDWEYKYVFDQGGFNTVAVSIGRFSSAWDRSCELYAQLMGTVVDYGVCHSRQYGAQRFGKNFTGQGMLTSWSASNPAHFVGHSLGGQTLLVFERLLRDGSKCAEDTSPLFTGGKGNLITSITSISGTLDGTTFVDIMGGDGFSNFIRDLVVALGGLIDDTFIDDLFDIDLTHWGLERQPGESFFDFWDRAEASGLFSIGNADFSIHDLSEGGARSLNNQRPQAYSGTYYFSIASEKTDTVQNCFLFWCDDPYEVPGFGMSIVLLFSSSLVGAQSQPREKQQNDGIVPFVNQICPTSNSFSRSSCTKYSGSWQPSKWIYQDYHNFDHLEIISENVLQDIFDYSNSRKKLFVDHVNRLKSISARTVASSETDDTAVELNALHYLSEPIAAPKPVKAQMAKMIVSIAGGTVGGVVVVGVMYAMLRRRKSGRKNKAAKEDNVPAVLKSNAAVTTVRKSVTHYLVEDEVAPTETTV